MSERGVFALDRGWFEHPMFAAEPFTEREAWAWLISEAAYKPHRRRIGNFQVNLGRGQLAASIRFLAEKWSWHRSKVDRFLERLKIETMVETQTETGITTITICKYDKYQRVSLPTETDEATPNETAARQQRDKVEDKEDKEIPSLRSGAPVKAKRIDPAWKPSASEIRFARQRGLTTREIDVEAEKFRNYWTAKGGREAAKLDWAATWRNWILNAVDRRPGNGGFSTPPPRPGSKEDNRERTHAALQELRGYIDAHADDARGGGDPGGSNAGLLPFAKPARS
jgi:hypothetical protein